jgi:mono/diheme cytochrome c family protein
LAKTILNVAGIVLFGAVSLQAAPQQASSTASSPAATQRALINRYCVTCHNETLKTAGLTLDTVDVSKVPEGAAVWEKVLHKLRGREMPPAGWPRPDGAGYDSFANYLETELDHAAAANPNPGRPVVHRLNRTEYSNSVRDLLALDMSAVDIRSLLPADSSAYGFDNVGEALTASPLMLEQYLSAARKIARLAIGDAKAQPVSDTYTLPRYLMQDDRTSEDLPFGTRGGIAVRQYFPADGEYEVRIRLQRNAREYIRGLAQAHQLEVRLDGEKIASFKVGGERYGKDAGLFSRGNLGDPAQEEYERVTGDAALHIRFHAKAGTGVVAVAFLKDAALPEGPIQQPLSQIEFSQYKGGLSAVGSVAISGPYAVTGLSETASRRRIFTCRPAAKDQEEACAAKILSTLARRAYRRPVTPQDVETLLGFFHSGRKNGSFDAAIGVGIERILLGPEFLFRVEQEPKNVPPGTAYRISDYELASRLSFFLWSSIPDDELLNTASRGELKNPAILDQQVRRMLQDSRAQAMVANFAGQWLLLRNLRTLQPDPDVFPYFDDNLREAFQQETELFFQSIMREDRSVIDLLSANYTYINQRLAEYYGIPNVYGSHFRRVTLTDEQRGGLLTQGSILSATSYANRTAPTLRGKWIMENVLGTPPPPPPPNVPSLAENDQTKALTMRQRMEQHRADPACATCHVRMDPLGFALENFDGTGAWRNIDSSGAKIDSSGVLPDGTKFHGPAELRKLLLSKRDDFAATVTERLLTYALGRGVEYYDQPAIRAILRQAAPNDYRWSSLVLAIVKSAPFQMRKSGEPATGPPTTSAGLH